MKKAFYLFLLCASFGYAQETASAENGKVPYSTADSIISNEKLLTKNDFNRSNGRMIVTSIPCQVQNDEITQTILVSVVCQQKAFDQLGVDKINEMIRVANEKVRSSLSLEHQYLPKEIKMAYIPDSNDWSLTNSFSEKDENGIVKERLLALDFDTNGKFAVMKRIL
jgi:hypothetical protein